MSTKGHNKLGKFVTDPANCLNKRSVIIRSTCRFISWPLLAFKRNVLPVLSCFPCL